MKWYLRLLQPGRKPSTIEGNRNMAQQDATPLIAAARNADEEKLIRLIESGADVNQRDAEGDTPLRIAASAEVAKILISRGADVNAKNTLGLSPLHHAVFLEDGGGKLALLLQAGANIETRDSDEKTPLIAATKYHHPQHAISLLLHGANPAAKSLTGESVFSFDHRYSRIFMIFCILDYIVANASKPSIAECARELRTIVKIELVARRDLWQSTNQNHSKVTALVTDALYRQPMFTTAEFHRVYAEGLTTSCEELQLDRVSVDPSMRG